MSCTRCNQRGLPIGSIGYLKVQCSAGLPLASTVVYQPPLLAISRWNTGWESCIYETYIPLLWRASLSFSSHQPYSTYTIYHYSLLLRCFSIVLQSLLLPSSSPAITLCIWTRLLYRRPIQTHLSGSPAVVGTRVAEGWQVE
jgi:hypothetical protein